MKISFLYCRLQIQPLGLAVAFLTSFSLSAAEIPAKGNDAVQKKTSPQTIVVFGDVNSQGRFPWTNGCTLLDAMERAGGYSSFADRTIIEIRTSGITTQIVNFDVAFSTPAKNPQLKPSDVVWVPRNRMQDTMMDAAGRVGLNVNMPRPNRNERFISVEGEVRRAGRVAWSNEMRLTAAIDLAGGFTESADPTRLQVRHFNGAAEPWNYFDATNSPSKNHVLIRGDRIIVPRKEKSK